MKAVWIVLAVLFGIILFLLLSILLYRPRSIGEDTCEDDSQDTQSIPVLDNNSFEQAVETLEGELARVWPELWKNLDKTALNHVYLLSHKGEEKSRFIVLIAENTENRNLIFNAADQMMKEYEELCSFSIVIPLTKYYRSMAYEEAASFLRRQAEVPDLILLEADGLKKTADDGYRAEIGCGQIGMCRMKAEEDVTEPVLDNLNHVLPLHLTQSGEKRFEEKRESLPFMIRLEYSFPFFRRKAVSDYLILYPEDSSFFYTSLLYQYHQLVLEGREETILKEDAETVRKAALRQGIHIKTVSFRKPESTDREGKGYALVSDALENSLRLTSIQDCLFSDEENFHYEKDVPAVCFSPLYNGKPVSTSGSAAFYRNLLKYHH